MSNILQAVRGKHRCFIGLENPLRPTLIVFHAAQHVVATTSATDPHVGNVGMADKLDESVRKTHSFLPLK